MKIEIVYKRQNMRGYKTATFNDRVEAFTFIHHQQPVEVHAIRFIEVGEKK